MANTEWIFAGCDMSVEFSGDPMTTVNVQVREHYTYTRKRGTQDPSLAIIQDANSGLIGSWVGVVAFGNQIQSKDGTAVFTPGGTQTANPGILTGVTKWICEKDTKTPMRQGTGMFEQTQVWNHFTAWRTFDATQLLITT